MIDHPIPLRIVHMTVLVIFLLAKGTYQRVHSKDIILENEEDVIVSVMDGTSLNVKCKYSGSFDIIDFQWKKSKNKIWFGSRPDNILSRTQWLNIEKVDFLDDGLYSCSINGSYRNDTFSEKRGFVLTTRIFHYDTKDKPRFIQNFKDNYVPLLVDSTLRLDCPFHSESDTAFSWYKNDKLLIERKAIIEFDTLLDNDYSLESVKLSDAGNYKCKVNNSYGSIQHEFTVVVYDKLD